MVNYRLSKEHLELDTMIVLPHSTLCISCFIHLSVWELRIAYYCNGLYAQLHYFLNFSQLLVSCLPLLAKLINSSVSDYCCHDY